MVSCVVDQDVNRAQSLDCLVNHVLDAVSLSDVGLGSDYGDAMLA